MQHGELQLAGAGGDDRVLLRGQDQHLQAAPAQGGDAQSVAAVDGDELPSLGVDQHPVVGLGAVEVEDDGVDVVAGGKGTGPAGVEEGGQRAGAGQVVRVVDLQHPRRVGAHQFGATEEAVPVGAEAGRVHGVGGTGLQQVLGAVLAARPVGLVVVDAVAAAARTAPFAAALAGRPGARLVVRVPPDEAVERGDGQGRVGALVEDRAGHPVDVLPDEEGAGALHQQDDVDPPPVQRLVRVQGVQDGRLGGGRVAGYRGGPQHHLGTGPACRRGGGAVVGGHHHVGHQPGGPALAHGARHQRQAAHGGEVLGGHALGAAAGGYHREHAALGGAVARVRAGQGIGHGICSSGRVFGRLTALPSAG